jgi:hypothetical protein
MGGTKKSAAAFCTGWTGVTHPRVHKGGTENADRGVIEVRVLEAEQPPSPGFCVSVDSKGI